MSKFFSLFLVALVFTVMSKPSFAYTTEGYAPSYSYGNQYQTNQESVVAHKGNTYSRIVHNSRCRYFTSKNVVVPFRTKEEAIQQGFRPCKRCGG